MEYTNQGTMWHNAEKKHDKAPDFGGTIDLEKDLVEQLLSESEDGIVKLKLDFWKGKVNTKNGERAVLKAKVNTWKPDGQKSSSKDPWDE